VADVGKRIGPTAGTGVAATLYTCAAANGFLWRSMSVANTTTTEQSFKMSIGADAAGTRLFSDVVVPPNFTFDWTGIHFIANTETIRWIAPTTLTVTITGVEQT
jgi:hypothetical protein